MKLKLIMRAALLCLIIGAGVVLVAVAVLGGCRTPSDDEIRSGHNTTFPPLPACLVFCYARIESSIDSTTQVTKTVKRPRKAAAAKPASAAGAVSAASAPVALPSQPIPTNKEHR